MASLYRMLIVRNFQLAGAWLLENRYSLAAVSDEVVQVAIQEDFVLAELVSEGIELTVHQSTVLDESDKFVSNRYKVPRQGEPLGLRIEKIDLSRLCHLVVILLQTGIICFVLSKGRHKLMLFFS